MHKRGLRTDGLALMVAVLLPACLMVGCTTAIKNGDIVAVKSRVFGISITTSDAGGSPPKIQIGLASTVVQMVPTSTNRLYAPRYADTMDMNTSGNPFHTGWSESTFYEQGFSATNESAAYSTQPERVTVTRPRLPKAITNAEVLNLSTNAL